MNRIMQRQKTTYLGKDLIACFKLGMSPFSWGNNGARSLEASIWKLQAAIGEFLWLQPQEMAFLKEIDFSNIHFLSMAKLMSICEIIWQVWRWAHAAFSHNISFASVASWKGKDPKGGAGVVLVFSVHCVWGAGDSTALPVLRKVELVMDIFRWLPNLHRRKAEDMVGHRVRNNWD